MEVTGIRILIDVGHPAHVHFFRNAIKLWEDHGHTVLVTARDKDVVVPLLKAYNLNYLYLGKSKKTILGKSFNMLKIDFNLLKVAIKFKPDVLLGIHDPYISHVGKLMHKPVIIFTDTELVKYTWLVFPFSSVVCTPASFRLDLGSKHIRYEGYHELAYLHPNYFRPNSDVLDELGLSEKDSIIIVRLISWSAYHDVGLRGLNSELGLIKTLEEFGHVFISSERKLNGSLEKYKLPLNPEKLHDLLYYARLYIGEGGTMAVESAILGTPAIHIESTSNGLPSGSLTGIFRELRDRYGLLYFYADQNQALLKAVELLEKGRAIKKMWRAKRENLLKDKIDVTKWMVNLVEGYPDSIREYRNNGR